MAARNAITPHARTISNLERSGWLTKGFQAFVFGYQFANRIIERTPQPKGYREVAERLFDRAGNVARPTKKVFLTEIQKMASECGREMTNLELWARLRRYERDDPVTETFVPDAWRLDESDKVVIEVAEVSDTHPLHKNRLYRYAFFDDKLFEAKIHGLTLIEINATSLAVVEHNLPSLMAAAVCDSVGVDPVYEMD
jgi:hypothetical protein